MKYIANFDDEYFGKRYKAGETVTLPKDASEDELAGPVKDGRLTKLDDGDPEVPALGGGDTVADPLDHDANGKKGGMKGATPKA